MALSYDNANTGLFTHLGKVIKISDLFAVDAAALEADVDEILDAFEAGDQDVAANGMITNLSTWQTEYVTRQTALKTIATQRLGDRDSVLLEIGAKTSSVTEVIPKLIERMNIDSYYVDANGITVPATATALSGAGNTGNGTIIASKLLDGITIPRSNVAAHHEYKGLLTQVIMSETINFRCTTDGQIGSATPGSETFEWYGDPSTSTFAIDDGSGTIGTFSTAVAGSVLSNGTFETFTTSNTPDNWDIITGAVGTNIFEDADTAEVYRGSKSLNLRGDGSTATIELNQTIASSLTPNKRYICAFRVLTDGAGTAGTLTVTPAGTGYSPGTNTGDNYPSAIASLSQADESIVLAETDLDAATSWTLAWFFFNAPEDIPSDFRLEILYGNTPDNGRDVWIDDLVVAPLTYGAGIGIAAMPGSTDFLQEDRFTLAIANDGAGTFQEYFRKAFNCQLPVAGSNAIADALAE